MYYTCRVFEWYDKVGGSTGIYVRGSILLGQCLFITTTTRMKGKHLKGRRKSGFLKIFFLRDCVLLLYVIDRLLHCNLLLNNAIRKLAKNILKYLYVCLLLGDVHKPGGLAPIFSLYWEFTKVPKSLKIVIATH